jgi:hypothetical protein
LSSTVCTRRLTLLAAGLEVVSTEPSESLLVVGFPVILKAIAALGVTR